MFVAMLVLSLTVLACTNSDGNPASLAPTSEPIATEVPTQVPPTATLTVRPSATPEASSTSPPVETTPEPAPEISVVVAAADLAILQDTLNTLAEAYGSPGEFSFAVTDMQTGETVGVNIDRLHLTACTVNYFVLLQSTIDAQNGRIEEGTVGDLISATIRTSNPVTARELYRLAGDGDVIAGLERVAELIDDLSGDGAVFDHPPLYAHESLGVDRNNWISAAAMN